MSEAKHVMPFPGLTVDAERYMLTPASNEEGYNRSSVVSFVGGVDHSKHFLLVHGSGDDNVHFQNSLALSEAMIQEEFQFDEMVYPDRNHGAIEIRFCTGCSSGMLMFGCRNLWGKYPAPPLSQAPYVCVEGV